MSEKETGSGTAGRLSAWSQSWMGGGATEVRLSSGQSPGQGARGLGKAGTGGTGDMVTSAL